jgi:hypothetical protein
MKEAMKPMHEEMKAYKKEKIAPVMAAKRAELDKRLKKKDRKKVNELRDLAQQFHADMKKKHMEMKKKHEEMRKEHMEHGKHKGMGKEGHFHHGKKGHHGKGMKSMIMLKKKYPKEFEQVWKISEENAAEIDRLMEELKPQSEQWHKDMKAIKEKHLTEEMKEQFEGMKPHHHKGKKGCEKSGKTCEKSGKSCDKGADAKKGGKAGKEDMFRQIKRFEFLMMPKDGLMADDMEEEDDTPIDRKASVPSLASKVFPNPSGSSNSIEFEVPAEGDYRVELYSKDGQLIKVVAAERLSPGTQRYDVDISTLPAGAYYYSISDGKSRTTQKFLKK